MTFFDWWRCSKLKDCIKLPSGPLAAGEFINRCSKVEQRPLRTTRLLAYIFVSILAFFFSLPDTKNNGWSQSVRITLARLLSLQKTAWLTQCSRVISGVQSCEHRGLSLWVIIVVCCLDSDSPEKKSWYFLRVESSRHGAIFLCVCLRSDQMKTLQTRPAALCGPVILSISIITIWKICCISLYWIWGRKLSVWSKSLHCWMIELRHTPAHRPAAWLFYFFSS